MGQVEEHLEAEVGMADLKCAMKQFAEEGFWNRYRSQVGFYVQFKRPVIILVGNPGTGKTMMVRVLTGETFFYGISLYF